MPRRSPPKPQSRIRPPLPIAGGAERPVGFPQNSGPVLPLAGRTDTTPMVSPGQLPPMGAVYDQARVRPTGGVVVDQVHQAALTYANQRLATLQRVAHVDPTLQTILSGKGDPLKLYAAASKRWTQLAKGAGYNDPRLWLRDQLLRANRG